jgi:hypothetical protein
MGNSERKLKHKLAAFPTKLTSKSQNFNTNVQVYRNDEGD